MGGPVYRYDAANPSTTKFPASLDGQYFAGEFGRGWIKPIVVTWAWSRPRAAPSVAPVRPWTLRSG